MFEGAAKARADLNPGTLYAATGEQGWIYYGQVAVNKNVGFFRHRTRWLDAPETVLAQPVMARVGVVYPSIGRALRSGAWKKLGRFPLVETLTRPDRRVQWPMWTLTVTIWLEHATLYDTSVDDPAIQDLELMSAWDALDHVPARLTADFGAEPAAWHVGGPIWRERLVKEERARRFPAHRLPADWVPAEPR